MGAHLPNWLVDVVAHGDRPEDPKLSFILIPVHEDRPDLVLPQSDDDEPYALTAPAVLTIAKVQAHVKKNKKELFVSAHGISPGRVERGARV